MIKFYVRTTLDRVLDKTYNQIEYELLIDYEHNPVGSFIKELKSINEDAVLLEDDLILCDDFKNKIEEVITKYPNTIINFFEDPNKYFTSHIKTNFAWNQCTFYPKGTTLKIGNEMERLYKRNQDIQYDILEQKAFFNLSIAYLVYRPCLVQHKDLNTLIQRKPMERRTPFFANYLDKLNIKYEDAYKKENLERLKEELKTSFRRVDDGSY